MILAHQVAAPGEATWNLVLAAIGALLAFAVYLWFWAKRPDVNRPGPAYFGFAMMSVLAIMLPAVDRAVDRSFTLHMLQHLVLWVITPILLILAHPVRTAMAGGMHLGNRALSSSLVGHRPAAFMFAWTAMVVTMYGSHLTPLYDLALRNQWVHDLEHLAYLGAALAFWSALLGFGRAEAGRRIVLALAVTAPMVFLGMILTTTDRVLYPTYLREFGPTGALIDQGNGGAVMWLGAMAAVAPCLVWLVWRWASNEHERQLLLEASLVKPDNGVDRSSQYEHAQPGGSSRTRSPEISPVSPNQQTAEQSV